MKIKKKYLNVFEIFAEAAAQWPCIVSSKICKFCSRVCYNNKLPKIFSDLILKKKRKNKQQLAENYWFPNHLATVVMVQTHS